MVTDFGDIRLDYENLKQRNASTISIVFPNDLRCSNADYETANALGISAVKNKKPDIERVKSSLRSKIFTLNSQSINFLVENITIKDYENKHLGDWRLRLAPNIPIYDDFVFNHHTIVFECYRRQSRLWVRRISLQRVSRRPYPTEGILSGPLLLIDNDETDGSDNTYMDSEDFEWLLELPKRRKDLETRLEEWDNYLDKSLKSIKNKQGWIAYKDLERISPTKAKLKISNKSYSYNAHRVFFEEDAVLVLNEKTPDVPEWKPNENTSKPESLGTITKGTKVKKYLSNDGEKKNKEKWIDWEIDLNDRYIEVVDEGLQKSDKSYHDPLNKIPRLGLLVNSTFSDEFPFTLQQKAIDRLKEGNAVNPKLEDFVFDIEKATKPIRDENIDPETLVEKSLNDYQMIALETSLNSPDISLIQGPPGTGKTTVIAEICHQIALRGGKVLLSSQSNLAVDNALSRISNQSTIMPIRLGRNTTEEGEEFVEEKVVKRWFNAVKKNVDKIVNERDDFRLSFKKYETAIKTLKECSSFRVKLSSDLDIKKASLRTLQNEITEKEKKKKECDEHFVLVSSKFDVLNMVLNQENYPNRDDFSKFQDIFPDIIEEADNDLKILFEKSDIDYVSNLDPNELGEILAYLDYSENDILDIQNHLKSILKLISQIDILKNDEILNLEKKQADLINEIGRVTNPERMQSLSIDMLELNKKIEQYKRDNSKKRLGDQWQKDITELRHEFEKMSSLFGLTKSNKFRDFIDEIRKSLQPDKKYEDYVQKLIVFFDNVNAYPLKIPDHLMTHVSAHLDDIEIDKKQTNQRIDDSKLDIKRLDQERNQLEKDIDSTRVKLENTYKRIELNLKTLRAVDDSIIDEPLTIDDNILESLKSNFNNFKESSNEKLVQSKRWLNLQKTWVEKIEKSSTNEYENLVNIYIDLANVVGATCTETGKYKFWGEKGREFDLVIIDEVSKATPPELLMPMLLGKQIILVGDHQQLPPIFRMNEDELTANEIDDKEPIKELVNKFKRLVTSSYFRKMFEDADDSLKARLVIQYRMHPAIMNAINQFYPLEYRLENGIEDPDTMRKNIYLIKGKNRDLSSTNSHLVWVDTGQLLIDGKPKKNIEMKESGKYKSRYNEFEVQTIRKMLISFNRQFEQNAESGTRQEIAIISFYAGQVRRLRKMTDELVNSKLINNLKCRIGTVDRFQGMESPIVIVSLVSSPNGNKPTSFVKEFRRINVAFSRAQSLLVIVGSAQTFKSVDVKIDHDEQEEIKQSYGQIINAAETGMNGNCFVRGYDVHE